MDSPNTVDLNQPHCGNDHALNWTSIVEWNCQHESIKSIWVLTITNFRGYTGTRSHFLPKICALWIAYCVFIIFTGLAAPLFTCPPPQRERPFALLLNADVKVVNHSKSPHRICHKWGAIHKVQTCHVAHCLGVNWPLALAVVFGSTVGVEILLTSSYALNNFISAQIPGL